MNGKEYVLRAVELVERVVSEIKASGILNGDPLLETTAQANGNLANLKNKATLRTRDGANIAYPVMDAAQNLEEAWEDARSGEDLDDLTWRMEEFINSTEALTAFLEDRTVILT